MEKEIVVTQLRIGKELYEYAKNEAKRLGVSINYALIGIIDDGRRFRQASITIHPFDHENDSRKQEASHHCH
jgi:hypothetical protein